MMRSETQPDSVLGINEEQEIARRRHTDAQIQGYPLSLADHRHEMSDVNITFISLIGTSMALTGMILLRSLWLMMIDFKLHPYQEQARISPLALQQPVPIPPRIEEGTVQRQIEYRQSELSLLHRSDGTNLSLDQAREQLLQRGFPVRSRVPTSEATTGSSNDSSGRSIIDTPMNREGR